MIDLNAIFTHFSPQDIEEFFQLYQLRSLRKKREEIVAHIHELQQQIAENEARLKAVSPSTIALATLTQFRAIGVDDPDLLDRMLERGDEWLDQTLQLFELCERLDILQENATQWCTHALEGAYKWIESMSDINEEGASDNSTTLSLPAISTEQLLSEVQPTEVEFLKKLMSEGEESKDPDEESENEACPCPDGETEEIEYVTPNAPPQIQEEREPTTQDLPPIELDSRDETIEHALELDSKHEGIEYTALDALPEIQEEREPTTQDLPPIELDSKHEETEYATSNTSPEIQEEREPTTQDLPPIELDSMDADLIQLEDPTLDSKVSEITAPSSSATKLGDNSEEAEALKTSKSIREPTKLSIPRQKGKHKKQKFHRNRRIQKKSR